VVRIEVERTMPPLLRELLQRELRFEESALQSVLGPSDVYEADGPLDLGGLGELAGGAAHPTSTIRRSHRETPLRASRGCVRRARPRDVLVHHPDDSFSASVERFIAEAADDPDVAAIKLTLYRPGGPVAHRRGPAPRGCRRQGCLGIRGAQGAVDEGAQHRLGAEPGGGRAIQ